MSHVDIQPNGCWYWTSVRSPGGYGKFTLMLEPGKQRVVTAHVWAWEQRNGDRPVYPSGHHLAGRPLDLDHFECDTAWCVNPDHLRPATRRENLLRADTLQARNLAKTTCPDGHPYDDANTRLDANGGRHCRTCGD